MTLGLWLRALRGQGVGIAVLPVPAVWSVILIAYYSQSLGGAGSTMLYATARGAAQVMDYQRPVRATASAGRSACAFETSIMDWKVPNEGEVAIHSQQQRTQSVNRKKRSRMRIRTIRKRLKKQSGT
ncbi:hypothetical protein C8R45DRAFT_931512 [Mycena sanguinolenta]|nr:hypothetical protein C8R45DRAFT_931512 [Mycena sanguinolenta]